MVAQRMNEVTLNSNRSWEDSDLYSLLTAKMKEISETLNNIQ